MISSEDEKEQLPEIASCLPTETRTFFHGGETAQWWTGFRWELLATAGCVAIALYTAIFPVYRAFFLVEVSYNEGWNVYNAWMVAHHLPLYGSPAGWTTVNYPALSFYLIAQLNRLTHDFLFTGRALSILGLAVTSVCVGFIVRRITGSVLPALLAASYCIALFCSNANSYVGADDPQLLAQAVFAAGLLLYIFRRESDIALIGVAFLFVLGGSIKHNQIDFPLAVIFDLYLLSRRRARNFCLVLMALAAVALYVNAAIGGRFVVERILTPRLYSPMHMLKEAGEYYPPLLIPFVAACATAIKLRHDRHCRVLSLFFVISLFVGLFFSGGSGVSFNAYFSNTVAIAILLGIFFSDLRQVAHWPMGKRSLYTAGIPLLFFLWLLIPMQCNEILWPVANWRKVHEVQARFVAQVDFLRAQPGPVLCESLLRCYMAGKPYTYDPFNSTSLIHAGRLDANVFVERIRKQGFAAIQFKDPPAASGQPSAMPERFVKPILNAAAENYRVAWVNKDCTIYVPKEPTHLASALLDGSR